MEPELEELIIREEMIEEMKKLFTKGQTNPSAITSLMYMKGFKGRFMEIRKIAEYQYKVYTMEIKRKQ